MLNVLTQNISGKWTAIIDPDNLGIKQQWFKSIHTDGQDAPVPGLIQQVFPDYHGIAWYWCNFRLTRIVDSNERCLLNFPSVDYYVKIWCNGKFVGEHEGSETPFTIDVTDAVVAGKDNLLSLRILNPTAELIDDMRLAETPHSFKIMLNDWKPGAMYNSGGILGTVRLEIVPHVRIADIYASTKTSNGNIRVLITVINDSGRSVSGKLASYAGPVADGSILDSASINADFSPGQSQHVVSLEIKDVHLWNLDDPYLYRVDVEIQIASDIIHRRMVRCGFRDFGVENGFFRLNGRRIFLKSTHTGNHFPISQTIPTTSDLLRRDMLMAKAAGYNMVRFISGMARVEQLDFCDEIGLMVYEEFQAGWFLENSPHMTRRFDDNLRGMLLRDRNHPSITIWGLLNETFDGPVFQHAVASLPLVRSLDDTRLVLLNSGRFDRQPTIGSFCNSGGNKWEFQWGQESPDAKSENFPKEQGGPSSYVQGAGDVHLYPAVPQTLETNNFIRKLGEHSKPIFVSEYGTGSLFNAIREARKYEEHGAAEHLPDFRLIRNMEEMLEADWERFGMQSVYPFPEDMLQDSQRLHALQRLLDFDLIRSNPNCCGFNMTGMLDHVLTGEGLWTFWREWKPGICEALNDGWAPLRWCLFVDKMHGCSGEKFKLEAVLANEDVLGVGSYPVCLRVFGPEGIVWEKRIDLKIDKPSDGKEIPLAISCFSEEVVINGPTGKYEFAACMERGGAPLGGRLSFYISNSKNLPHASKTVLAWHLDKTIIAWMEEQGIKCKQFDDSVINEPNVILVGKSPEMKYDRTGWKRLVEHVWRGGTAIFLSPEAFAKSSKKPKIGELERSGQINNYFVRKFDVINQPEDQWEIFSQEMYGDFSYLASDLPDGEYTIELGMCPVLLGEPFSSRIFNVEINGERVLNKFDVAKEAGEQRIAVIKTFTAKAENGKISINFISEPQNASTLSRLRIYDANKQLIAEDSAHLAIHNGMGWLPLAKKGRYYEFNDWLYHKECVAKAHPIFDGLQSKGIMDWDYYGQVVPKILFENQDLSEDIAAVAFAVGYPVKGGYASGVLTASYKLGHGKFIINTLNILENVGSHPAADRLLLNMITYAANEAAETLCPLSHEFGSLLNKIGFDE